MQEFKEHWIKVRTPEQFNIMYGCAKQLATEANAPIVNYEAVSGLQEFQAGYTIPELNMEINKLSLTLTGKSDDMYGLRDFLLDRAHFPFQYQDGTYYLEATDKKHMKQIKDDLIELTGLWGWQLNM